MVTRQELYARVNSAWPAIVPPLTFPEAKRAAKRLLRFLKLPNYHIEETSGNRYTWIRNSVLNINLDPRGLIRSGWQDLVHMLTRYAHRFHDRSVAPHAKAHARLELRTIKEVVKRGWLDGRLKDKPKLVPAAPTPIEERSEKIEHARAKLREASTRLKRATTILKKWQRRIRHLERWQALKVADAINANAGGGQ